MKIQPPQVQWCALAALLCAASNLTYAASQATFTDIWKDAGASNSVDQAYEVKTTSSFSVSISLPLNGVDLSEADPGTMFSLSIGPAGNTVQIISDTLGDAENYTGKNTATWPLTDPNTGATNGSVTVSWTATNITVTGSTSETGFGAGDVLGEEQTLATASTGTPYTTNLSSTATGVYYEMSVGLDASDNGGGTFSYDNAFVLVTGSDKETEFTPPDGTPPFPLETGSIAGAADVTPPVVTITSPAANAKFYVSNSTDTIIELSGKASDSAGVASIEVYLNYDFSNPIDIDQEGNLPENSLSWTASNLDLTMNSDAQLGANIITVTAVDTVGNQASVSSTFLWIQTNSASVMVIPANAGTVKGIKTGQILDMGVGYPVTATAASKSWIFSQWTDDLGNVLSSNPTFDYLDTDGVLIANFLPNPFAIDLSGPYTGLFFDANNNVAPSDSGYITVTVTTTGAYSGKLYLANPATSFALSGQLALAPDGSIAMADSQITVSKSEFLDVNLQIATDTNLSDQTLGSFGGSVNAFTDATEATSLWSEAIMGELSLYNANDAPGLYNLAIQPAFADPSQGPGGSGYGSATVAKTGAVALVINLADGTSAAIPFASSLAQDGTCPFFASLYGSNGVIFGWLQFATDGSGTVQGNSVNWVKLPVADKFYTNGFSATPAMSGALYVPPKAGTNVFGWTAGTLAVDPGYSGLNLPDENDISVTFNPAKNTFTCPKGTTITNTPSAGALSGTFVPVGAKTAVSFHGVTIPGADGAGAGYGFYSATNDETGPILLSSGSPGDP